MGGRFRVTRVGEVLDHSRCQHSGQNTRGQAPWRSVRSNIKLADAAWLDVLVRPEERRTNQPREGCRATRRALGLFPCLYAIEELLPVAMKGVSAVSDCLPPYAIVRRCVDDCGYMARVITTIRMDERLREAVEARARIEQRSISNMVERLVAQGLNEGSRHVSGERPRPGATPWGGTTPGVFRESPFASFCDG